jgi:23S rRNA (pseudouridine1915-N3)-methyltransferase
MRITLAAVGRAKPGPARDLYEQYVGRLNWRITLKEVEERRALPPGRLKEREGELLLAALPAGAKVVALDESGKTLTSKAFARLLGEWRDSGEQDIAFVIGGADGLSPAVRDPRLRGDDLAPYAGPRASCRTTLSRAIDPRRTPLSSGLKIPHFGRPCEIDGQLAKP